MQWPTWILLSVIPILYLNMYWVLLPSIFMLSSRGSHSLTGRFTLFAATAAAVAIYTGFR